MAKCLKNKHFFIYSYHTHTQGAKISKLGRYQSGMRMAKVSLTNIKKSYDKKYKIKMKIAESNSMIHSNSKWMLLQHHRVGVIAELTLKNIKKSYDKFKIKTKIAESNSMVHSNSKLMLRHQRIGLIDFIICIQVKA